MLQQVDNHFEIKLGFLLVDLTINWFQSITLQLQRVETLARMTFPDGLASNSMENSLRLT